MVLKTPAGEKPRNGSPSSISKPSCKACGSTPSSTSPRSSGPSRRSGNPRRNSLGLDTYGNLLCRSDVKELAMQIENRRSKPERAERHEARLTPEQKSLFTMAADLAGRTLSDFRVISSAIEKAHPRSCRNGSNPAERG